MRQHMQLVGRDAEHGREIGAQPPHALAAERQRVAPALAIEAADRRARLHRVDDDAVADGFQLRDMRRLGKGFRHLGGVAVIEIQEDVARRLVVQLRRARLCPFRCRRHRRQRIDVADDGLGRVLRLRHGLGDGEGHGLADMAHARLGERRPAGMTPRRAVAVLRREWAFQGLEPGRFEIGRPIDAEHARHFARVVECEAPDRAVRHRRAHHHGVSLARQVHVVGIAALAAQQGRVLLARHRLAHAEFHQRRIDRVVERVHEPLPHSFAPAP